MTLLIFDIFGGHFNKGILKLLIQMKREDIKKVALIHRTQEYITWCNIII